jgi:hypothetical protein
MRRRFALVALCTLFSLSGLVGCTSKPVVKEDEAAQDLSNIGMAYGFVVTGDFHPPRDIAEIKKVLDGLHRMGKTPPTDEVLVSSRDGEPYVIILGARLGEVISQDILAYEKKGADGKRYVLLMDRSVRQLSDEEFKQATFAQRHRPGV